MRLQNAGTELLARFPVIPIIKCEVTRKIFFYTPRDFYSHRIIEKKMNDYAAVEFMSGRRIFFSEIDSDKKSEVI